MKRILSIAILILLIAGAPVYAADVTAALDLNSAYVWRGTTFNNGFVAQPSMDITKGGFGFNVWGNMDIGDYDDTLASGNFSEVDLTLSYGLSFGPVDVGMGIIEYLFPDASGSTREVYTSVGVSIVAGLSAGLDLYYDVDELHGLYTAFTVGYAYDITEKFGMEASGTVGYISDDEADQLAGLHDYIISLSAGYGITDALSVSASLNYAGKFDDDVLADHVSGGGPGYDIGFFGGIGVSYAF